MCCIMMTTNHLRKQALGRVFFLYIYSFPRLRGKRLSFCHISLQHPLCIFYPSFPPPRRPSSGCSAARPFVKASQCPSAITCCLGERVENRSQPAVADSCNRGDEALGPLRMRLPAVHTSVITAVTHIAGWQRRTVARVASAVKDPDGRCPLEFVGRNLVGSGLLKKGNVGYFCFVHFLFLVFGIFWLYWTNCLPHKDISFRMISLK